MAGAGFRTDLQINHPANGTSGFYFWEPTATFIIRSFAPPDENYEASLLALEEVVFQARGQRFTNIVGVDANAVFGPKLESDSGTIVGEFGICSRSVRRNFLVGWLHGIQIAAAANIV